MAMDGLNVAGEVVVKGQRWEMQLKASGWPVEDHGMTPMGWQPQDMAMISRWCV